MTKITIDRELLLEKLNKVYKFVPAKSIIPALDNILFDVKDNKMSITAFNGEVQCKLNCAVKCKEDISFCLPAKLFVGIIRLLRENELTLTLSEVKAEIKCGKSKYNMAVNCKPDEFPRIEFKGTAYSMTMLQTAFINYAERTSSFCGSDDIRPALSGMFISFKDKELFFYGCTGAYMCKATVPVISVDKWNDVIVPSAAVKKVCSLLNKGEVNILHSDNIIMFSSAANSDEDFEIIATCVNEKFPNVYQFFTADKPNHITVNTSEIIDAIARVKLVANPISMATKLSVKGNLLELSCSDVDFGNDGEEIISVTNEKNNEKIVGFNTDFLLKIFGNIDDVETNICWSEEASSNIPFLFKGNTELISFEFVLCQMMLDQI